MHQLTHLFTHKLSSALLAQLIEQFYRLDLGNVISANVLTSGLSNETWQLNCERQIVILRLNLSTIVKQIPINQEIESWALACKADLAPKLLWVSPCQQLYLSEFIVENQQPWARFSHENSLNDIALPNELERQYQLSQTGNETEKQLLSLLTQLRQLPLPTHSRSIKQHWEAYCTQLKSISANKLEYLNQADMTFFQQSITELLNKEHEFLACNKLLELSLRQPQFCHMDLNPFNLLFSNSKLYCIDFEYACASHPLFELAVVLATHQLTPRAQHWLIAHYLHQHPCLNKVDIETLQAAIKVYWLFSCCWALLMAITEPKNSELYLNLYKKYNIN